MEPRKILIVRLGALGDVIHAVPAQQALRRRFPEAEIHWLTEPPYRPLLEAVEGLDKVWTADTKSWRKRLSLGEMSGLLRRLRGQRFDLAVDFQGLLKSAVLARLARPRQLIGFRAERFKEAAASWFYARTADGEADLTRNIIDTNLHLLSLVLDEADVEAASPYLPLKLPQEDVRYVDRQLEKAGVDQPPVLLNPGAGWETKLWPAPQFARLGRAVEEQLGLPVVYTWGPGEEPLMEQISRQLSPRPVRTFPTTILQLAALCRRSRLFVGGDTGPLHLAAGLSVPVVAVMGPTTATRNGPFDPADEVVQWSLHCSDCYKRTCDRYFCMNIPPWEVLRAVTRRLKKTAGGAPGDLRSNSQSPIPDSQGRSSWKLGVGDWKLHRRGASLRPSSPPSLNLRRAGARAMDGFARCTTNPESNYLRPGQDAPGLAGGASLRRCAQRPRKAGPSPQQDTPKQPSANPVPQPPAPSPKGPQ
ncbi:MAG TPA: glycosyltransferase family 9 protein [Acidobacteriota bacterium]|nr:glycosyltransferase family 9 protein [Acidobacteriota bacterium]